MKPRSVVRNVILDVERPPGHQRESRLHAWLLAVPSRAELRLCQWHRQRTEVEGPVSVTGADPSRLDADGDGVGCQS
jgi:hypothetical protein